MGYSDLTILIPSYSVEDLPSDMGETATGSLLNAFAVAWHPLLLATSKVIPGWHRADEPPDSVADRLVLIPMASERRVPKEWLSRASEQGATVVAGLESRSEMIEAALAGIPDHEERIARLDPELTGDFLALGTCYLMMELLTRHMHYYNDLDEVYLQREGLSAAEAALAQDAAAAREHLRNAFESLTEARERFYPVDSFLLDLCLLSADTPVESISALFERDVPVNFLIPAAELERLAERQPETVQRLRSAWAEGTIGFAGGEYRETPIPLVPLDMLLWQLDRGLHVFENTLGRRPKIWGRKRFGLTACLPQILTKYGYQGALHLLLDEGTYPEDDQSKIRWQGCDGSVIDAVARVPLPADRATSFLDLPQRLAESMEQDQTAAMFALVREADAPAPWLDDLRRMQAYAPSVGQFVTFAEFFERTDSPGRLSRFEARQYLSAVLHQAASGDVIDPLSRHAKRVRWMQQVACAAWYRNLARFLSGKQLGTPLDSEDQQRLLETIVEGCHGDADRCLNELEQAGARELEDMILRGGGKQPGYLVLNTLSFPRTIVVYLPDADRAPDRSELVLGTQFDDEHRAVTVKVPGSGFVWIPRHASDAQTTADAATTRVAMAEENVLRNDYIEAFVSEQTGGLLRLNTYRFATNRLSQQLAFRFPWPRNVSSGENGDILTKSHYSEMRCRSCQITSDGPELGEIVTTGDIVDQVAQTRLAGFRQTFRVWRRRPILELAIELEIEREPEGPPWSTYFASRFAWNDSTASLTRSVLDTAQGAGGERIESPHFLEIATETQRTTILFEGMPFHRKTGPRMLDTLLVCASERRRSFRFWIAVDQDYPMQVARDLIAPAVVLPTSSGPPKTGPTGWFFQLDSRNVQLSNILPLVPDTSVPESSFTEEAAASGKQAALEPSGRGLGLRLVETEGRSKSVALACFQTPRRARQRDFLGHTIRELPIREDRVCFEMAGYEIADIELFFD